MLNQFNNPTFRAAALGLAVVSFLWSSPLPRAIQTENQVSNIGNFVKDEFKDPFAELDIEAGAYLVFDFSGNIIAEKNSGIQWSLASISKIMTALTARELIRRSDEIVISLEAIMQEGDSGFEAGERFLRDDLLDIMLISSSNDAAYAVAEHIGLDNFARAMNENARELKMVNTYFINPSGLDVSKTVSGAYGSAEDLMILIRYVFNNYPGLLEATGQESLAVSSVGGIGHKFTNTNRVINQIPGLIAGKTGFTDIAGGNLLIIADIGIHYPVGIIVLGSSEEGRFEDMIQLYEAAVKWHQAGF